MGKTYPIEQLKEFTQKVFQHFGIPKKDAIQASEVLALSDLRGIDSHGVARLYSYVEMLSHNRINPKPNIRMVRENPSVGTVDGDNGLGLIVGPFANNIAMEKAEKVGSGWISVFHTNHFGIAGYYPTKALEKDLIGITMTNSTKLVAPLHGAEKMLGTNPIAIAFPTKKYPPVLIDLATSAAAYGKIEIARRHGKQVPEGWIVNRDGMPTTIPQDMMDGGAILPLGSDEERGGHKGYALSAMVDILTSVLSGANFGPFAPPFTLQNEQPKGSVGKGIGHFFGAMRIDGFMDTEEFKSRMDTWVETFRATKPAKDTKAVLIPGDPEHAAEEIRSREGIPIGETVVNDLRSISKKLNITFD